MRRRDQDVIHGDTRLRRRHLFDIVEQFAAHHATVCHHNSDRCFPIRRNDGPRMDLRVDLVHIAAEHAAVDQHGQFRRCDVDDGGSRFKLGVERDRCECRECGEKYKAKHAHQYGRELPFFTIPIGSLLLGHLEECLRVSLSKFTKRC